MMPPTGKWTNISIKYGTGYAAIIAAGNSIFIARWWSTPLWREIRYIRMEFEILLKETELKIYRLIFLSRERAEMGFGLVQVTKFIGRGGYVFSSNPDIGYDRATNFSAD
jgi:hypothetical protein